MNQRQDTYKIVSQIPSGKVLTYGLVAKLAGIKNARLVGNFLHKNNDPQNIPCHRVVNAQGKLATSFAFGGLPGQTEKLQSENVLVANGKVDLNKYLWNATLQ